MVLLNIKGNTVVCLNVAKKCELYFSFHCSVLFHLSLDLLIGIIYHNEACADFYSDT